VAGRHYIEQHTGAVVRVLREGKRLVGVAMAGADNPPAVHATEAIQARVAAALKDHRDRRQAKADELADYALQRAIEAMAARREAGRPRTLNGWKP